MKKILVAVDGSESSQRAVALAADLAARYGGELVLMNVMAEGTALDGELLAFARSEGLGEAPLAVMRALGTKAIADGLARAGAAGAQRVTSEISAGDPADTILAAARGRSFDLIVVGHRGRGQLAGLLLGSVSQKLANEAPCPVLIAR
jgi:nucleotide-binding universal stress UspA family protein